MDRDLEKNLERFAYLTIHTGVNLQPGQQLIITAPTTALPLVQKLSQEAYRAGASLVTPLYSDDQITLARFRYGHPETLDTTAQWLRDGVAEAYEAGAARLAVHPDIAPGLLADIDPKLTGRAAKAEALARRRELELITSFKTNWSIVAYATPAWAKKVFPSLSEEAAVTKLWGAIFRVSRLNHQAPEKAWEEHNQALWSRVAQLNARRYAALRFAGPGTDLTVGLADHHRWSGGASRARNGVVCNPNIPTEEVFTTPHRERVDGKVRASRPFDRNGTVVEGLELRFEGGRVVEFSARTGQEVFGDMLRTDEGASRLGEVALVPHSSPVSQSGLLYFSTLFDENAASHLAQGQAYSECMENGDTLPAEVLEARGANGSLVHEDWMIGSGETDVEGITQEGRAEPLMRSGEWVDPA